MRGLPVRAGVPATASTADVEVPLFLTPKEVSVELGLPLKELREMRVQRTGPQFIVFTAKTIWYWRVDVLAWKAASGGAQ